MQVTLFKLNLLISLQGRHLRKMQLSCLQCNVLSERSLACTTWMQSPGSKSATFWNRFHTSIK